MIGWVSSTEDSWEAIGRKMKECLRRCLEIYPIADWSETIRKRKEKTQSAMNDMLYWTKSACEWDPIKCNSANFHIAFRTVSISNFNSI